STWSRRPAPTPTCGSAPRRGRRCSWCGPRGPTRRSTTATTSCPTTSRTSPSPSSPTGCCPPPRLRWSGGAPSRSSPTLSRACAFALGERDLLRAGVLVLVLPLLCTLAVARTRYRLACARRLAPPRVQVGQESRVDLRLENVSRLPSGLLMVEDRVPYALGGR